ncbi:Histidinol dehydrogenase [Desulfurobacterium thermolithotrophum DSM 11699]|uniref:Histidinol dehydrogenase n=1 Tax=Desulfurobacterium thermolithotrophum (strain DSM 11699 / BSA) TaxID=868864 RepID=F0S3D3_DESTD|nr:histidinol dehydrogenase [Desulfurobacterium thermolithotrophum]ADY73355.1 Histidinol dehydrogenase [Desulfurobacterium thermolithotrophum DSM 11699]
MKIVDLRTESWEKNSELLRIKNRGQGLESKYAQSVLEIIENVKKFGDSAVFSYAKKFDKIELTPENVRVTEEEIEEAFKKVEPEVLEAIKVAVTRVRKFHEHQKENSYFVTEPGMLLGQKVTPLESAGIYVPGGKASYPSSVIMNAVPAKVAGVKKVVMITPAIGSFEVNPYSLVAAKLSGVDEIYRVGGAHGVAAIAFGTESIPKVDKIVGPGNIYVALAKKFLFGTVDIDMVAGPSEILVIADESANPDWVAVDLLSQAEHDELAGSFLVTHGEEVAKAVIDALEDRLKKLKRREIAEKSIENFGTAFITRDIYHSCEVANIVAPEHLEVATKEPFALLDHIKNAGAIFLGHYTCESLGDYILGPNHVLPTGGSAKFFSPLGVYDFIKRSSILYVSKEGFKQISEHARNLAECEGLEAHRLAVEVREAIKIPIKTEEKV